MLAGDPVGVVGVGTIGTGIAEVAARAGHPVVLYDGYPATAETAAEVLRQRLDLPADWVRVARTLDGLAGCALVIEATAEDPAVKRDLLTAVEKVVGEDTPLATNTSSHSVTVLARALRVPGRLVGMHFVNPVTGTALVEVVRGHATSARIVATACAVATAWGKKPVVCESTPGFVVNRVTRPFMGEAQRIVEERVADPGTVDELLRLAGGFPSGPFELSDRLGQDIDLAVTRSIWEQTFHDQRYAPTVFQQRLVDAGLLGTKTGTGVFRYDVPADHPRGPRAGAGRAPRALRPASVRYKEGFAVMEPIVDRIAAGGVRIRVIGDSEPECTDEVGLVLPSGGRLVETGGDTAGSIGDEVVSLDWVFDPVRTSLVAVAASPNCSAQTLSEALGTLQAARLDVVVIEDTPGMIVARTISMIINEATDLVSRGDAHAGDVDIAMMLAGVFPQGPLQWGERLGPSCVVAVLDAMHRATPTGRYRTCQALRLAADTGSPLRR